MDSFNSSQKKFLEEMSTHENEDDWIRIPGYVCLVERREKNSVIALAGVTMRYGVIPSLFIAVSHLHQGKGIATEMMTELLRQWNKPLFLTHYRTKIHLNKFYEKFGFHKIMNWGQDRVLRVRL